MANVFDGIGALVNAGIATAQMIEKGAKAGNGLIDYGRITVSVMNASAWDDQEAALLKKYKGDTAKVAKILAEARLIYEADE